VVDGVGGGGFLVGLGRGLGGGAAVVAGVVAGVTGSTLSGRFMQQTGQTLFSKRNQNEKKIMFVFIMLSTFVSSF
jgi:outer membrane lipoprotein SlyB